MFRSADLSVEATPSGVAARRWRAALAEALALEPVRDALAACARLLEELASVEPALAHRLAALPESGDLSELCIRRLDEHLAVVRPEASGQHVFALWLDAIHETHLAGCAAPQDRARTRAAAAALLSYAGIPSQSQQESVSCPAIATA